ncbi:MAG TPA: ATP-binding protein [Rhizomicrobium sp.]|jgi:PAS domain S-box-containing protein
MSEGGPQGAVTGQIRAADGGPVPFALVERAANFGCWRYCIATQTMSWSDGMYRLLQIERGLQCPDSEWLVAQICADDRPKVVTAIEEAVATKSPFRYRTRSNPDYHVAQTVDTYGEVELDRQGNVIAVIGVCWDVTAQVTANAEREAAQRMFRLMAQEASDMIILYGADGRIVFASDAFERMTGRAVAEVGDDGCLGFVHPEDRAEAEKLHMRPLPGQTHTATFRFRHRDGHYLWLEFSARGIFHGETGAFLDTIAVGRDVTGRKTQERALVEARERAEAASRAKSTFLANMSHELRTPLNAIMGFADLMLHRTFGEMPGRYEEYVRLIRDSGGHLLALISDLLDMAKIEAGKLDLQCEPVDLADMVRDCAEIMRASMQAKSLMLTFSVANTPIALWADRRALKQVLLNVLSNAVKFTPAGGSVTIATEERHSAVAVVVADTGIGIAGRDLARLGGRFEQVCDDPALAKAGTGLGLSLVRALVEQHGGTLHIESTEQVGTRVTLEFLTAVANRSANPTLRAAAVV